MSVRQRQQTQMFMRRRRAIGMTNGVGRDARGESEPVGGWALGSA